MKDSSPPEPVEEAISVRNVIWSDASSSCSMYSWQLMEP